MGLAFGFLLTLGAIWGLSVSTSKLAVAAFGPISVVFWYALIAFLVIQSLA